MTAKLIGIGVALVLAFLGGLYVGHLAPELKDAKAEVKQISQNQTQEATDATRINVEAKTYAAHELDPIAAPVVRVLYAAGPAVPRAAAAGPQLAPACLSAASTPAAVPGPDIGRPLVQIGHDADAQVEALWDYIDHVCRVKAP